MNERREGNKQGKERRGSKRELGQVAIAVGDEVSREGMNEPNLWKMSMGEW